MQSQSKMWVIGASLATLLLLALCDTAAAKPPGRGPRFQPGPPAHAPAYGVRRKQVHGFQLTFDVGLGVYVAVGVTDVYYHEGYFYRVRGGVWEISLRGDVWGPVVIEKLPPGLQVKAKSMVKLNGNGNSLVKLNGNGNSLVKLNGNAGSNDNQANAGPSGNSNKPNAGATGTANKPAGDGVKPGAATNSSVNKPNAEGGKASGNGAAGANQPNGSAGGKAKQVSDKPAGSGAQPDSKPAGGGKAGSAPKGKKK